jgi:hypothetical protein
MDKIYHKQVTKTALEKEFSPMAMENIIAANLRQDGLFTGIIGHPEFHFDNNQFIAGQEYVETQRQSVVSSLSRGESIIKSWRAFGRLLHAVQDFYSHSNYISLWADKYKGLELPQPEELNALNKEILENPQLQSGKINYLHEALHLIPLMNRIAQRILAGDSHAKMNIDNPGQNPLFPYVFEAAKKRTLFEYQHIELLLVTQVGKNALACFKNVAG